MDPPFDTQDVLDSLPVFMFWKDRESVYVGCNRHYSEELGLSGPHEIAGKTDYDLYPRCDAELYRSEDADVMSTGKSIRHMPEHAIMDGKQFWVLTCKSPIWRGGNIVGVLGVCQSIGHLTREKQLMSEAIDRFEALKDKLSIVRDQINNI